MTEGKRIALIRYPNATKWPHDFGPAQGYATCYEELVAPMLAALKMVMDYRQGKGQFDLTRIADDQRDNVAFDKWMEVEQVIKTALSRVK